VPFSNGVRPFIIVFLTLKRTGFLIKRNNARPDPLIISNRQNRFMDTNNIGKNKPNEKHFLEVSRFLENFMTVEIGFTGGVWKAVSYHRASLDKLISSIVSRKYWPRRKMHASDIKKGPQ
jgi:hypothetical protein